MFQKFKKFLKIDLTKLKQADRVGIVWLDIFMIWLVIQNLLFYGFNWSFHIKPFNEFYYYIWPAFHNWYATYIEPNFAFYDLLFVAVFFIEFMYRWIRAIVHKKLELWWIFPFTHWYDVIGLIPMAGIFKFFRLFRLISLIYKLQYFGVIDLKATRIYKTYLKATKIIVEEISDRVVVNIIEMTQAELTKGGPLADKIISQVIIPKEDIVVNFLADKISNTVDVVYKQHRLELKSYISTKINKALEENNEVQMLRFLPVVGSTFQKMLDNAVSDITFNTIDKLITEIGNDQNKANIELIVDTVLDAIRPNPEEVESTNHLIIGLVNEVLEVVKEHVAEKEWLKQIKAKKEADLASQ